MQTFPLEIDIQYKDLSDEDQAFLARICQRKKELLQEIEWLSDSIFCLRSRRTLVIADNFDGNGILGTEGRYCVTKEDTYHVAEGQLSVAEGQYHGVIVPQALTDQQIRAEINDVTAEIESIDNSDQHDKNPKTQLVMIGRKKFNMDPKKGIEYLVERGLLQLTAEEVAQFLFKGEGLNKTAIGDYLGERHDFNIAVLKAFVTLNDFCGMILVQALRQFLWSFRLPGEAQKIDRMMECFAQRYCDQNPGMFKSTDTCYVLSFAIIMLNTSLHNPSVRDKPAVESFIKMNRGINEGGDLPRELLENLYNSIKNEPFKIPEDDGNDLMHTFFNPVKEGWLCKQGGRVKSWKRRWFILNDNCLYYFEFTTDKEPKGIIPLENVQVREIIHPHRPNCFEIHSNGSDFIKACKTDSDGKVVEGKHMVYKMSASSSDDREDWIRSIRASVSDNPFYDLLAARRRKATQL